ncbi:MAG: general secretion pathway protein GspB [Xanthomonadales bacterium]|nr:general secretion pathway protein GspB [Xanthomonadales bacterium]
MSLILEALKKSEAERRLGQAPDLLSPTPMRVPSDPRGRGIGPALGIGLALVVTAGVAFWFAYLRPEPAPSAPTAAAPVVASVTAPAPQHAAARPRTQTPARPTNPLTVSHDTEAMDKAPMPRDDAFASNERESLPVRPETISLPAHAESSETVHATEPVRTPRREVVSPAITATNDRAAARMAAEPSAASTAVPVAPAPTEPALEALPRLGHLLPSEREGLPPLRLSMHVYDPAPAARFVLIDGKRYREGDAIAKGLTVEAIRPDGAALSYHGRRFLLARP